MAEKEATVYIVDVGKSMGEKNNGRDETDLEWCLKYVWDKITTAVATGRKTLFQGIVGLNTDKTENELAGDESYEHISVLQPLSQILMPQLRTLREQIRLNNTETADAISALVIAIQMMTTHCKKLKYTRRIVLITNARGPMDTEELSHITEKIKEDHIELVVLGPDFDDPEYGVKEENKNSMKVEGEETLRALTEDCDGVFGTMAQAIEELDIPRVKSTKPVVSYKGLLTLGDPEKYDSAMTIDVERYPRTMQARPPTASSYVVRSDLAPGESQAQSSMTLSNSDGERAIEQSDLAAVKQFRCYQVADESVPGGKREVDAEDLSKGYTYGSTAVHISESERNITDLETFSSLDIIGFIPGNKFERYMEMSRASVIISQKANEKASMALSSFIHALYELDSYAVARFVAKDNREPAILLLAPEIKVDYECLVDVELPFAEDMRGYRFPPLDRIVTVAGKTLHQHRNLPADDLIQAMSDYVDHMDLSTAETDDDGNPTEYAAFDNTYSPVLHRVQQVIRWRAIRPMDEIPPPPEILTKYSQPPEHLLKQAQPHVDAMLKAANVKRVPPKQKGRKRTREFEKPLSGLNVEELLGREKRVKISAENAIPEFKQTLDATEDVASVKDAAKQLAIIIHGYIRHSMGDSGYSRAVEAIRVMKEEMIELEEPGVYNDFLRDLKKKIVEGELGGERREMWYRIRVNRLGLIDKRATELSDVSEEEGRAFLSATRS